MYYQNEKLLKNVGTSHRTKRFLNTIKCENDKDDLYVIWVIMWCLSFKFNYNMQEKQYRVNQLIGVLLKLLVDNKTFKQTLPLFEDILNTVLKYGDLQMVTQVLVLMNYLKIKRNSTIDNIFFMAIRKNKEITKKKHGKKIADQKVQKISDMILEMEKQAQGKKMYAKCINTLSQSSKETLEAKTTFTRRTFKPFRDLNNMMIKDTVSMHVEKECDNCKTNHTWNDLKKCQYKNDYDLKCLECGDGLIINLNVTIGTKHNLPMKTYIYENQIYLTIKGLRTYANELYDSRLENATTEIFDLMILRDLNKQIFWNCIFHMVENNLPYDFFLPYEDTDLILRYKYVNRHIKINVVDHTDDFNIVVERSRRNKSVVPHLNMA